MPKKPTETITVKYCGSKCPFWSDDEWGDYCAAGTNDPGTYGGPPPDTCPLREKNVKVIYA